MKRYFVIFMIVCLLFVDFVVIPVQKVEANPILKIVDRGAKTLVNRFGYKMHSNKTAQEVSEILIHKMKKQGIYDDVMNGLNSVEQLENKLGFAKWIIPAGTVSSIAGILHGMAQDTGELEEIESIPSPVVPEPEKLIIEGSRDDSGVYVNPKIVGVDFPLTITKTNVDNELGGAFLTDSISSYFGKYDGSLVVNFPNGERSSVGYYPRNENDFDYFETSLIESIVVTEMITSSNEINYQFTVNVWDSYFNKSVVRSIGTISNDMSVEWLVDWLKTVEVTDVEVVEVPEMPLHEDIPVITPETVPEGDLEISIPNDEGMSKWFNNDEEIYLNRIANEPELTDPSKNAYVSYEPYYIENPSFNPDLEPSPDNPKYISNPNYAPNSVPAGLTDITALPTFNPNTGINESPIGEDGGGSNPSKPDDEGLNLDPLKNLGTTFTNKFPFSLPWDIKRGIDSLKGSKEEPVFRLVVPSPSGTVEKSFTLPEGLLTYVPFIRGSFVAVFLIGLVFATRRLLGGSV